MVIIEDDEGLVVYDREGGVVYYVESYTQCSKINAEAAVILTTDSAIFLTEVKVDGVFHVNVVTDTNYVSALIHKDHVFVARSYPLPVLDVFNQQLVNVLRLYKNIRHEWSYVQTKFGLPVKTFNPIGIQDSTLFASRGGKRVRINLKDKSSAPVLVDGEVGTTNIQEALLIMKESDL